MYLSELIKKHNSSNRTRRATDHCLLSIPPISKMCANSYFELSFSYAAPFLWNRLGMSIRMLAFDHFKRRITRCTRGVRVVFSVTRMRSSNSARINKFDFRTEKSCSVHMTVFEIVAGHNVVNWMQLLT